MVIVVGLAYLLLLNKEPKGKAFIYKETTCYILRFSYGNNITLCNTLSTTRNENENAVNVLIPLDARLIRHRL